MTVQYFILLSLVLIAALTDVWKGMIYNWLTLPVILLGSCLALYSDGWMGFLSSLFGVAIGGGTLFIPFCFGVMGGGDVKLMAAIGALMGPLFVCETLVVSILAGGCTGIILMVIRGKFKPTLVWYVGCLKAFGTTMLYNGTTLSLPKSPEVGTAPFGVSILIGTGFAYYFDVLTYVRLY